ncbi:hypothetical protein niasHS_003546 [Heterodera schachtii]|uniref:Uncharacterized protein n=1 Tax=Heterodera schachtii TaxID=97005 RepID=A0ABD2KGU2_HETSC
MHHKTAFRGKKGTQAEWVGAGGEGELTPRGDSLSRRSLPREMEAKDAALVLVGRRRRGGREKQRAGPLTHCERARQCTSKEFPPPHPLSRPSPAIILARESRKKLNDYELFEGSREMKPVEGKLSRVKTLAEQRSSGRRECWGGGGKEGEATD